MTTYYIEQSNTVELFDGIPAFGVTTGEGNPGQLRVQDDFVHLAATASPLVQAGSSIRMCRIPTNAKVKSVVLAESTELDTHSADDLVLDLNIAFSDAPLFGVDDGTQPALAGQCPTSVGNATTVIDSPVSAAFAQTSLGSRTTTTAPAYSTPNILFGQITPTYNAIFGPTDYVFNGATAQNSGNNAGLTGIASMFVGGTMMPLYAIFGFANNANTLPQDPGGFFDLVIYISTAAGTAAAGYLYGKISFVV